MKAVIFAESGQAALELVHAARILGADEVVQVAFEQGHRSAADMLALLALPEGTAYENACESIQAWFKTQNACLVLSEPTRRLKIIVGTLAASCKASALANITSLEGDSVSSLYFGGVASKESRATSSVAFYYLSAGLYDAAPVTTPTEETIAWIQPAYAVEVIGRRRSEGSTVSLSDSSVVVACGRGFAAREELDMAFDVAAKLDAEVGCSRPLTEAVDWFPREAYIGVSGEMLKPKVYLGIGISGQMQHMIGTNTAGTIFAINKDKDAPIFKQCDHGLIGDLKQILPALAEKL